MDIQGARDHRRRLQTELDEISRRAHIHHQIDDVIQILQIEIRRLDDDIDYATQALSNPMFPSGIKIPVHGGLNTILIKCKLLCSASVIVYSSKLKAQLCTVMGFSQPFPYTAEHIEEVLAELEVFVVEKRRDEIECYGFSDVKKCKEVECSCYTDVKKFKDVGSSSSSTG